MKLLIIAMLAFAPMTSFARTIYGESDQDLTTITVLEYTMTHCEQSLAKANAKLNDRNKAIIVEGKCVQEKTADAPNVYAVIKYHKYL